MTTTTDTGSTAQAVFARARERTRQRLEGLQSDGIFPAAVLRDPPQLPDLRRGRPDRPAASARADRTPTASYPRSKRRSSTTRSTIPVHGATRVEQELRLKGIQVSSGGVRAVWQRNSLLTKHERLSSARKDNRRAQGRTLRRADPVARTLLAGVPRTPHVETPAHQQLSSPSSPSSSACPDRASCQRHASSLTRSICRPLSTTTRAKPGRSSNPPVSCRSPPCTS